MDPAERHSAGAIIVHQHPFDSLEVPESREPLPQDVVDRWVIPLYMKLFSAGNAGGEDDVFDVVIALWPDMTEDIVRSLLTQFNWRPRLVGAYVAAFMNLRSMTGWIGRLLLRSDVCYAACGYCVALAHFNTSESQQFILEYLDYYLTRKDLCFDQDLAMCAIAHLDARNATSNLEFMMDKWRNYVADRRHRDLKRSIDAFGRRMAQFDAVSARCARAQR